MSERSPLLLVGCGKMGGVLLSGWLASDFPPEDIIVVETGEEAAASVERLGVRVVSSPDQLPASFSPQAVLFAVKPQILGQVAPAYRFLAQASPTPPLFISIAAGCKTAFLEDALGGATEMTIAAVRAMPNTPAAVGRGMTVCYANPDVSKAQHETCSALFESVGDVAWIVQEDLMDAVTAISGSGPAYVFLLAECLANAGRKIGLDENLATALAQATVSGSGELMARSREPADILRRNVTSPGGTTAAALDVLMGEDGLGPLLLRAVRAATQRSRELSD